MILGLPLLFGIALVAWASPGVAQSPERWMLMGRHGDCTEIASLKRKIPELGEVTHPAAFVELMRRQGLAVDAQEIGRGAGKAMIVNVPKRELSIMFATANICDSIVRR